jgi:hypothetical protein
MRMLPFDNGQPLSFGDRTMLKQARSKAESARQSASLARIRGEAASRAAATRIGPQQRYVTNLHAAQDPQPILGVPMDQYRARQRELQARAHQDNARRHEGLAQGYELTARLADPFERSSRTIVPRRDRSISSYVQGAALNYRKAAEEWRTAEQEWSKMHSL